MSSTEAMPSARRRLIRTVMLWLCVVTELLIVAAFVDVVGVGGAPWYGQAGADIEASSQAFEGIVTSIDAGSAAARAGLRSGDLVDVRTNSALERWQWFDGFPTPIVGQTTSLSVTRGARHLLVSITPTPWDLARYWYFWVGPAGMFFAVLMAAVIAWRGAPTAANLSLAATLLALAAGSVCSTNCFALRSVWAYVALDLFGNLLPVATALWIGYAATFGVRRSRTRRVLATACFGLLAVIAACTMLRTIALTTLWIDPMSWWMHTPIVWTVSIGLAIALSVLAIRAANGVDRQRAAWSLSALTAFFTIYFATTYLPNVAGTYELYAFEIGVFNINFFTLPVLLAYVAVSRRLIDIGFVLNRATVFALVSATIIGAFMTIEWALGTWLTATTHLTSSSISLAIAIALGLSLRFVHHNVDRFVDHVIFRKRHEDEAALYRFAHECSFITDATVLEARAVEEVMRHTAFGDVTIVRPTVDVDENDPALIALAAWGNPLDLHAAPGTALAGDYAFPMLVRGTLVGALVCGNASSSESIAPDERKALATVAHGVAIALESLTNRNANVIEPLRLAIIEAIVEMRDAIVTELRTSRT